MGSSSFVVVHGFGTSPHPDVIIRLHDKAKNGLFDYNNAFTPEQPAERITLAHRGQ
jgi:hypothetical protein